MIKNLLAKIKKANRYKTEVNLPKIDNSVFDIPQMPLPDLFKQELEKVGGHAYICDDTAQVIETLKKLVKQNNWKNIIAFDPQIKDILQKANIPYKDSYQDLPDIDVGINSCQYLAAWTGSVIVSSDQKGGRKLNIFSPELIIIARKDQLVLNIDQALKELAKKSTIPSQISVITGPSKTADIEKTLIYGMHGPKNLFVIIY